MRVVWRGSVGAPRPRSPPETPEAIAQAIEDTGAQLTRCAPEETSQRVAADVAAGYFPGSRAVPADNATPFGVDGYRGISYEIVEQLGHPPDAVYLPVGGGDGLFGVYQGFVDLRHAGLIDRIPRMMAVRTTALIALSIADDVGAHAEHLVDLPVSGRMTCCAPYRKTEWLPPSRTKSNESPTPVIGQLWRVA